VQCFSDDYKKEVCDLLDNTQRVVIGSKNVVVRIWRITPQYVYASTSPTVLKRDMGKLKKIPEKWCRPIFGEINKGRLFK
jgi:hypothetical protein